MDDASAPEPRPFDRFAAPPRWLRSDEYPQGRHEDDVLAWCSVGTIYRFYDAERRLLYIGQCEGEPTKRWVKHRANAHWWPLVAFVSVAHVTWVKAERLALEKAAIQAEQPLYNKVHGPRAVSRSRFTVSTRNGPEAVVEQFREHLLPADFAVIAEAFAAALKAEPPPGN